MTEILQVGNRIITAAEIIPLLVEYQMLPQLIREAIVDQAIAPITCTPEEKALACQQFYQQNQLNSETALQEWQQRYRMTLAQLENLAVRQLKIEKFKQATWENKLESYFLSRKGQLDKVFFSLIRIRPQEAELAQELYFRIQEEEQSFAELAREYAQGREAQTGGLNGPVELGSLHPILARMLSVSQPGQLWPPTRLEEWVIIVRLEKFIPVQMDESMRQRLLNELFSTWLQEQVMSAAIA